MTEPGENLHSESADTQPIRNPRRRIPGFIRWGVVGLGGLAFLVVVIVLALPSLAKPPANISDPYEVFSLGDSSEMLDPGRDHLVLSADERVGVYIPTGADLGPGQFLILERRAEFIPGRVDQDLTRLYAVDLLVVRPDGELDGSVGFDSSILLCFQLDAEEESNQLGGEAEYFLQRYTETSGSAAWITLQAAPGWEENQVCSALSHLSLYALVRRVAVSDNATPVATATSQDALPKGNLSDLYGIPTPSPTP